MGDTKRCEVFRRRGVTRRMGVTNKSGWRRHQVKDITGHMDSTRLSLLDKQMRNFASLIRGPASNF